MAKDLDFVRGCVGITPDLSYLKDVFNSKLYKNYSEDETNKLKSMLLEKFQTKKNIIIDNGSSAIIEKLAMRLNNFIIQENDFYLYELIFLNNKKDFEMFENVDFFEKIKEEKARYKHFDYHFRAVAIFSILNNITGEIVEIEDIIKIAKEQKDVLFIVDGAYRELSEISDEDISLLLKEDNIAYMGTFSKAYGLAGIRVGYLIGLHVELLAIPFLVSNLSSFIARNALSSNFVNEHKDYINKEQQFFLEYYPFIKKKNHKLFIKGDFAKNLHDYLKNKKIYLTLIDNNTISFSINTKEKNLMLREEIDNFINLNAGSI